MFGEYGSRFERRDDRDHDRTIDAVEQELTEATALVSRLDAARLRLIRELDAAQVWAADGSRTMDEWVAARLDIEPAAARRLVRLARAEDDGLEGDLADGAITTDRAMAVVRLRALGASDETIEASYGWDLSGVRRSAARHRRISSAEEADAHAARFLHLQPTLDETSWRLWGQLSGTDGRIVEKAIQTEADSLPSNPETTAAQDRADALVSVCSEWLSGDVGGHELAAEVFIDGALAAVSDGEAGASIVTGPRVGPNTLAEILCAGTTRITIDDGESRPVSVTPTSRTIPSAVRSFVLERDRHRCAIDGCVSRSRLQPHHLVPFAEGGDHAPENLVTLCWYHHHVVVHQQGRTVDLDSPPGRRRFTPLRHRAGP